MAIRSDLARLGCSDDAGNDTLGAGMVAQACQAITWSGPGRKLSQQQRMRLNQGKDRGAIDARLCRAIFAAYATAHGRNDLAQETTDLGTDTGRFANLTTAWMSHMDVSGIPGGLLTRIVSLYSGARVAGSGGTLLIVWLGLAVLLWRTRIEPVRSRDLALSMGLCGLVAAVAATGILVMRIPLPVG